LGQHTVVPMRNRTHDLKGKMREDGRFKADEVLKIRKIKCLLCKSEQAWLSEAPV